MVVGTDAASAPAESPQTNLAAVLHGIDDLRVESHPLPEAVPEGHVRIAIKAIGICGSDVHYWKKGRIADFVVKAPMVIGHESAGEVVAVGPGVKNLQPGDRVAIEPGVPCWSHHTCREGRYNLDPDIRFFATPPHDGSLCQFVDHPEDFCFRLPDNVSYEEGAFCEPLSVGVHACRRGQVAPGKRVAILGSGPIGLVTLLSAKAFGADEVAVVDPMVSRLEVAKSLGADAVFSFGGKKAVQAVQAVRTDQPVQAAMQPMEDEDGSSADAQVLKDWSQGKGPDVIIDCAGFEGTLKTAVKACAQGGKVVTVGMGVDEVRFPNTLATVKEVDIIGSFRYANTYPVCLNLLQRKFDIKPLITHRFGFSAEDVQKAFQAAADANTNGAIKVMFNL